MKYFVPDNVSHTETEYGVVILDHVSGNYWNLNGTGALVWRSIISTGSLDDAVESIVRDYKIDAPAADVDVQNLLAALLQAGIIISDKGAGKP